MPWHAQTLVAMDQHDGKAYPQEDETIQDEVQAAYELPQLEGGVWDEQRRQVEQALADGTINLRGHTASGMPSPFPEEELTFDPMRGLGMPGGHELLEKTR